MSADGIVLKDLIDEDHAFDDGIDISTTHQSTRTYGSGATGEEPKGQAQIEHNEEIDIGWGVDPDKITHRFIEGIDNEDVWIWIRRFNKLYLGSCSQQNPYRSADNDVLANISRQTDFQAIDWRSRPERIRRGRVLA
jgi:hypothetical protein